MNNNIKDKRILLLCENFYDYDIKIKEELLKLGAKDVYLKNAEYFFTSLRNLKDFSLKLFLKNPFKRQQWSRDFEKEIKNMHFDLFLCIENTCFTKKFMQFLRRNNPGIKTVLFLWDTYKTQQGEYKHYRHLFDKTFSFDRDDAKKYGMEYFPDFYIPQKLSDNFKYDISFVGTANATSTIHRFEIINYIYTFCKDNNLSYFLYLRTFEPIKKSLNPFRYIINNYIKTPKFWKLIDRFRNEEWLHFESIPLDYCNAAQSRSRVLLDLSHHNRQGMTINCITALAHGQKLITTNQRIKEEPFYDPNMIYILDENNPKLDISFWNRPNKKVDLSYLRLDNWLLHIFDEKNFI